MRSSAGEHLVHTEGVTGSIPVASTILYLPVTSEHRDSSRPMPIPACRLSLLQAFLGIGNRSYRCRHAFKAIAASCRLEGEGHHRMRVHRSICVSLIMLAGCGYFPPFSRGTTLECPSTTVGRPFYAVIGSVEPFLPGHPAALVTIIDGHSPHYAGDEFAAVELNVLKRTCPKLSSRRPLSPQFNQLAAQWRQRVLRREAGLFNATDFYDGLRDMPPIVDALPNIWLHGPYCTAPEKPGDIDFCLMKP